MSYFKTFVTKSGCGPGDRGNIMWYSRKKNVSLEKCQQACLDAGTSVCRSLEFRVDHFGDPGACGFWSGVCTY